MLFSAVLCFASIPTACTGLVKTASQLYILRAFIGVAGGTFVMCQYWTSVLFAKDVVGTANALVGGWGNLGAGVTQLVMGRYVTTRVHGYVSEISYHPQVSQSHVFSSSSFLFPLFKVIFEEEENASERAWRSVSIVPAIIAFITGIVVYFISDDAPKGNYSELRKHGAMPHVSAVRSFKSGSMNFNSWVLFIQYACCFGVELTMNNAAALYFKDSFGLSTETAAAMARYV